MIGQNVKKPAVFIDRDGTINEQMGYINHVSRFVILPGVVEALRLLNENGFHAVIVSNQSGVARGYFPLGLVHEVHDFLDASLKKDRVTLDGIFFCPHHPNGSVPEFTKRCNCRKPRTGLIDQACRSLEIDLQNSFAIGDRCDDIEFARRAGVKGILVKTGYGLGEIKYLLPHSKAKPVYIAEDLLHAVQWIINVEKAAEKR
jgi:D-glycero-D-manno-heptose 1,7-bisphosphate phosphatase